MKPDDLIETALLLGVFVLLAGCWGVLYCVARLRSSRMLIMAAWVCYGGQLLVTTAIIVMTPLAIPWKVLIMASLVACARIPPVTWHYLRQIHQLGEQNP